MVAMACISEVVETLSGFGGEGFYFGGGGGGRSAHGFGGKIAAFICWRWGVACLSEANVCI